MLEAWRVQLWRPVDGAGLVWVRVTTGVVLFIEICRYLAYGWIEKYYLEPSFHFSYYGFDWVKPWPGVGLYVHFWVLGLLSILLTVGLLYRAAALLFCLGFTYIFLLDETHYLNHLYLVCLLTFLLAWVPANRMLSLDARLGLAPSAQTVPAWSVWLLRAQVGLVYFWGGIAKLNSDWLRAMPMLDWMEARRSMALIGPLLAWDPTAWAMSYAGLLLDLLLVPALLWRRTRWLALLAAFSFHLLNHFIFSIGIFPWLMMALTLVFCEPDWPRQLLSRLRRAPAPPPEAPSASPRARVVVEGLLAAWLLVQILLPLRHWAYPGEVSWTEEGHRFSWHMKLRSKSARAAFRMREVATGREWAVRPEDLLSERQVRKMKTRPDMIQQFCHHIAAVMRARGHGEVEVYADVWASLNGRTAQPLIDPDVNLAAEPRVLWPPAAWIVPLQDPLPGAPRPQGASTTED